MNIGSRYHYYVYNIIITVTWLPALLIEFFRAYLPARTVVVPVSASGAITVNVPLLWQLARMMLHDYHRQVLLGLSLHLKNR